MKTKLNLLAACLLLAALNTGLGQTTLQFSTNINYVTENAGSVILTVQRTGDTDGVVSVDYASTNGTAIAGSDYMATNGTLIFAAGEANQTIAVLILNDGAAEPAGYEAFTVTLSNPINAVLGPRTIASVRITDNDKGLVFEFASYSVAEDAGSVLIGVVRTDDGDFPVSVDYFTTDGTAIKGLDYTGVTNTLFFAPGDKVQTFTVPILNDGLKESSETCRVTLSNPTNQVLGAQKIATITILDNDAGVQFQPLNQYWITENEGALTLTVARGNDGNLGPFTVDFATSNLTATAGSDYTATNGTLSFAQGEMAKAINVPILQDEVREPGEQFKVILTNPTGDAVLGHCATVTVTIVDTAAIAAPGSWTRKADMPAPTCTAVGCAVDGIFYIIGGRGTQYTDQLRTVFAYDPQTDSWTRKKDMPTARRWPGGAAVDGIIYVIGGGGSPEPPFSTVEAYDPKADTWTTKTALPIARGLSVACALDGIIYVIGGFTAGDVLSARVEAYDPKTDQWTRKRDFPRTTFFSAAGAVGGVIYVFQGTDTFAYDPKTDRWTAKAHFSPDSFGLMSATVDGIIYLFGGMDEGGSMPGLDFALAYDPAKDQFTARRKMPRTRAAAGCAVIDGKIYLAGGVDTEPIVNLAVFWKVLDVFDPQGGLTPQILSLTCESTNHVRLMWQGEAGLRYGVESRANAAAGPWTRVNFVSGGNSILATNSMVEVTCLVPTADTNRFFRVLEL